MKISLRIAVLLAVLSLAPLSSGKFHRDSSAVPASAKFTVTQREYPGLTNPNPRGWYYKCANVVLAKDGTLVAAWQISDNHTSMMSHIMVARSTDGGRVWGDYQVISRRNVWEHQAVWVVPQMSALPDGRIVILDYTTANVDNTYSSGVAPFIRSYHVTEKELVRP